MSMSEDDPGAPSASRAEANRRVVRYALFGSAAAFAFAFSLIPLYRVLCEITGINYTDFRTSIANAGMMRTDEERWVTVHFDGSVHGGLGWEFRPEQRRMRVRVGELYETQFFASNPSRRATVGQAVPSVAPTAAALYFNKTECFCFTEQLLEAGEGREMPVRFVVDPNLPRHVEVLTLSYAFFLNENATERLSVASR